MSSKLVPVFLQKFILESFLYLGVQINNLPEFRNSITLTPLRFLKNV